MKGVSSNQKCKIRVISLDKTSFGGKKGLYSEGDTDGSKYIFD